MARIIFLGTAWVLLGTRGQVSAQEKPKPSDPPIGVLKPAPRPYTIAPDAALEAKEAVESEAEDHTRMRVEFNGIKGDRVPGFLYLPKRKNLGGPLPAILLQYGIGGNKKTEYIVAIGKQFVARGFIVLTIDAPEVGERRTKEKKSSAILGMFTGGDHVMHYCGDYSRALDFLLTRPEIDKERLGFVGISWGAITGITFVAYDPRIRAMASLVGGGNFLGSFNPKVAAKIAVEGSRSSDPVYHVARILPRPLLFVNVTRDQMIMRPWAESLHRAAGPQAKVTWLETDHYFRGLDRAEVCASVITFMENSLRTFDPAPSPDKDLLQKIEALPDNTWMKLPPFKTAGDLSWLKANSDYRRLGPTVRDYCNRMIWAPERKRALYCGAGHNIHPRNDVWEYDLASNTWICLYAPDPAPPRDDPDWYRQNVALKNGVVRTPRGAPVRPAHTWWGLCYDTDNKRLVFWDAHKGILFTNYKQLAQGVGLKENDPLLRLSGSGPGEAWVFTFDPEYREWKEVLTGAPKAYESSQLEYLPGRKTLWLHSGKTYVLDPEKKEWTPRAQNGPGQGVVTAHDPETRTIVAAGKRAFVYSCDQDQWTPKAELPDGDRALIPSSMMAFDSRAKRFILCTAVTRKDKTLPPMRLWLYDPKTDTWSRPTPQGEVPTSTNFAGYYDPERNVTVLYNSREMWVYRCRK